MTVTDVRANSVSINWMPPASDGGARIGGYVIEKRDKWLSNWTRVARVERTTNSYTISNLYEDNEYYFRVCAENEHGISEGLAVERPVVPKATTSTPSPPEGPLRVKDFTRNSITIVWSPPLSDGGSSLKGYVIEKREKHKFDWSLVSRVDQEYLRYTVTDLIEGNEYLFRVYSENAQGKSLPLESARPVAPQRPAGKRNHPK